MHTINSGNYLVVIIVVIVIDLVSIVVLDMDKIGRKLLEGNLALSKLGQHLLRICPN